MTEGPACGALSGMRARVRLYVLAPALACACQPKTESVGVAHDTDATGGASAASSTVGDTDELDGTGSVPALPSWTEPDKDIDILLVVDDSGSMGEEQTLLVAALESMLEVLDRPEIHADWRIAITTTDGGTPLCPTMAHESGRFVASSCRGRTQDFVFPGAPDVDATQIACLDLCPSEWADIPLTDPWIERIDGVSNLPAGLDVGDAIGCLVPMGIAGCGYEAPLRSMSRALAYATTPGEPEAGFLRDDAHLWVVFVTDEIDASTNPGMDAIWSPQGSRVFWSDPTADMPTSAVAWNAGVACTGTSPYDECHAADFGADGQPVAADMADTAAVLTPLHRFVDELAAVRDAKRAVFPDREVFVAVIAGASVDGEVVYADAENDPMYQDDFGIGPGCQSARGRAVPPVRLRELAEAFRPFGSEQNLSSICADGFGAALESLATSIASQVQPACLPECAADSDPSTSALDPSCTIVQEEPMQGTLVTTILPPCTPGGELPSPDDDACVLYLTGDARSDFCTEAGTNLEISIVRREGVPAIGGTTITADCELDPACPGLD